MRRVVMSNREEDVVDFFNGEVGDVPKILLKLTPTTYCATFDAKKTAEKAVGLNERRLEGTGKKIRATLVESRANLWDAISFITEKLEAEERKAMKMGNSHQKEHHECRRRTWVVEGEPQESQASVAGVKAEPKSEKVKQQEVSNPPPQPQSQPQPSQPPQIEARGPSPPHARPPQSGKGVQRPTSRWQGHQGRGTHSPASRGASTIQTPRVNTEPSGLTSIAIVGTHVQARVKVTAKARGRARVGLRDNRMAQIPLPNKLVPERGQAAVLEPKVEGVQACRWKGGATWAKIHPPQLKVSSVPFPLLCRLHALSIVPRMNPVQMDPN